MAVLNRLQGYHPGNFLSLDLLKTILGDWVAWSRMLVETVVFVGKRQW
jgi:hypothetical protein